MTQHPLDAGYYSVVDEPQLSLIFGFTLVANSVGNWNPTENFFLTTYHSLWCAITVLPTRASHPFQYVPDGSGMDVRALTTLDASSTRRF